MLQRNNIYCISGFGYAANAFWQHRVIDSFALFMGFSLVFFSFLEDII